MSNILTFIKEYDVIIAAAVGALASLYISKTQFMKATYSEMYKNCYSPIYDLLRNEIEHVHKTISWKAAFKNNLADIEISKQKLNKYKKEILDILDKEKSSCPAELLILTENLSVESFGKYCWHISDNYYLCQSRLGISTLKPDQSIAIRRMKIILSGVVVLILVVMLITSLAFLYLGDMGTAFVIWFIAIYIIVIWTLLVDRKF